jgi:D-beta-D-heptose 7-phosphate kinase/D-beta-D-heptose 1-phosphate adenosyltransferase
MKPRDPKGKICKNVSDLRRNLEKVRKKNPKAKIVFTNGCFDILHAGHVSYLNQARSLGDVLVIGLNKDASVKKLKGSNRPVQPFKDRALILASLECVDWIVGFSEETPAKLIKKVLPDVLVKGGDYQVCEIVGADIVQKNGGSVKVLAFVKNRSSSKIIEKIRSLG